MTPKRPRDPTSNDRDSRRSHPPPGRTRAESETRMSSGPPKPWTPLDDERLRSLAIAGMDASEIATELERTVAAVRSRAERKLRVSLRRVMVARRSLVEKLKAKKMSSPLTAAEREMRDEERKAAKRAEARVAMADQVARATAFNDNRERLRSARLAREAELKAKGK